MTITIDLAATGNPSRRGGPGLPVDVAGRSWLAGLDTDAKDELGAALRAQAAEERTPPPVAVTTSALDAVRLPACARGHSYIEGAGRLRFAARNLVRQGWHPAKVRLALELTADNLPPDITDQAIDFGIAEGQGVDARNLVAEEVAEIVRPAREATC